MRSSSCKHEEINPVRARFCLGFSQQVDLEIDAPNLQFLSSHWLMGREPIIGHLCQPDDDGVCREVLIHPHKVNCIISLD